MFVCTAAFGEEKKASDLLLRFLGSIARDVYLVLIASRLEITRLYWDSHMHFVKSSSRFSLIEHKSSPFPNRYCTQTQRKYFAQRSSFCSGHMNIQKLLLSPRHDGTAGRHKSRFCSAFNMKQGYRKRRNGVQLMPNCAVQDMSVRSRMQVEYQTHSSSLTFSDIGM